MYRVHRREHGLVLCWALGNELSRLRGSRFLAATIIQRPWGRFQGGRAEGCLGVCVCACVSGVLGKMEDRGSRGGGGGMVIYSCSSPPCHNHLHGFIFTVVHSCPEGDYCGGLLERQKHLRLCHRSDLPLLGGVHVVKLSASFQASSGDPPWTPQG